MGSSDGFPLAPPGPKSSEMGLWKVYMDSDLLTYCHTVVVVVDPRFRAAVRTSSSSSSRSDGILKMLNTACATSGAASDSS